MTFPSSVMDAVREEAPPRGYSRFIAEAARFYIQERRWSALRERLIAGCQADARCDEDVADDWLHLEDDVWLELLELDKRLE